MKCLDAGTLQAYIDSELTEARMRRAASHLEACAKCRERMGQAASAAVRVHACLDALAPQALPAEPLSHGAVATIAARTAGWRGSWAAAALVAALAALFFANLPAPKPAPMHPLMKAARLQTPQAPPVYVRSENPALHGTGLVAQRARRLHKPKPQSTLDGFMALDDADPMQMGMVVRMMVPVSGASMSGGVQEVAADLMIGEDGRARAIRFVE